MPDRLEQRQHHMILSEGTATRGDFVGQSDLYRRPCPAGWPLASPDSGASRTPKAQRVRLSDRCARRRQSHGAPRTNSQAFGCPSSARTDNNAAARSVRASACQAFIRTRAYLARRVRSWAEGPAAPLQTPGRGERPTASTTTALRNFWFGGHNAISGRRPGGGVARLASARGTPRGG